MERIFYAKTLKKDRNVWVEEFSKYLCRFAKEFDFTSIDADDDNTFVHIIKNVMLKKLWKNYSEEDLKQLEFLSRRNPDDLNPKDFNFIAKSIFDEPIMIAVGKRINAGLWCNKCNITMTKLGHAKAYKNTPQDEVCPWCGSTKEKGLVKTTGFTFQFDKEFWRGIMKKLPETKIYDEFNTKVSADEFMTFTYSKVVYSKCYKYLG